MSSPVFLVVLLLMNASFYKKLIIMMSDDHLSITTESLNIYLYQVSK